MHAVRVGIQSHSEVNGMYSKHIEPVGS